MKLAFGLRVISVYKPRVPLSAESSRVDETRLHWTGALVNVVFSFVYDFYERFQLIS